MSEKGDLHGEFDDTERIWPWLEAASVGRATPDVHPPLTQLTRSPGVAVGPPVSPRQRILVHKGRVKVRKTGPGGWRVASTLRPPADAGAAGGEPSAAGPTGRDRSVLRSGPAEAALGAERPAGCGRRQPARPLSPTAIPTATPSRLPAAPG